MKTGTEELLACLKRQRSLRLTTQHFADLIGDIEALGKDKFLDIVESNRVFLQ